MRRAYGEYSVTRTLLWSEEEKEEGLTGTFRYSRTGELKQVVLPDGTELTINHAAAGRESERRGGRFLQTREYRYDGAGNVTGARTNLTQ
ncbi:hypothetical protein [Lonsdalea quercina]|uniref:hypothetical protein n=1 Tax=Lonsdalea quercina TaxID=71657 RepID=UPI0039751B79